jgi:OmpA-OmpF porin, OOP family
MLFGFGKSTLRPEGKAKLDEVVGKLAAVNVDSIADTGHADRIGSSKQNQKMSVDRAEAVKSYLVSKGVHAGSISVVGKGETEPVTAADACKGAATAKVIACLQPDRRVEIEVLGTNKMVSMN